MRPVSERNLDCCPFPYHYYTLQWRHNDRSGVSNHWRPDCLLSRLVRRRSNKTSKFRVTGLFWGNPQVTGGFPHKGSVTRKCFHLMTSSWTSIPNPTTLSHTHPPAYLQVANSRIKQIVERIQIRFHQIYVTYETLNSFCEAESKHEETVQTPTKVAICTHINFYHLSSLSSGPLLTKRTNVLQ